jgi:hypothetical protein
MAVPYPSYTPERLLARVEQLEDIELPSLPSFQHDDPDFESGIITEAESSLDASDYSNATHMPLVSLMSYWMLQSLTLISLTLQPRIPYESPSSRLPPHPIRVVYHQKHP